MSRESVSLQVFKCLALAVLTAAFAPNAKAQWYLGGDIAYLSWNEASQELPVTENGVLVGFDAGYTQAAATGFLFAYRGKVYSGAAKYSGAGFFDSEDPAHGTTGYFGTTQEVQARYRFGRQFDALAAMGGDFWRRELNARQEEDYSIVYVALGGEFNMHGPGVTAGARLSLPVWVQLDANLTAIGIDQNPVLTPGSLLGGSMTFGYRFSRTFAVISYYDLFRFAESPHRAITVSGIMDEVFQPATTTYVLGIRFEFTR